ncbi:hypothetical protein [Pleomorphovibrio marinus]|uniref:hypothetical protein n=1 Tax=Pleomorphovibrio marinus TaxID=2164132 RepID=UPI000E0B0A48|nr:hypothetical protein [Pleomorphovibrio marinus]
MGKITDQNYLKDYSRQFAKKICSSFFEEKEHIGGSEIVDLTSCRQLNLLVIKALFERWQTEIAQLKKSPYFNYGDTKVEEAFVPFKNSLSNAIRVNRENFEPLLEQAVIDTVLLGAEPRKFFETEIQKGGEDLARYLADNKRYIKWRSEVWQSLESKVKVDAEKDSLFRELERWLGDRDNSDGLVLLEQLEKTLPINHSKLHPSDDHKGPLPALNIDSAPKDRPNKEEYQEPRSEEEEGIDPALAWAKFEKEEYGLMQGSVSQLSRDIAINQRFMFTKTLFDGDPDRMQQALEKIDAMDNFMEAVEMLNESYVQDLNWDVNSEEVQELLQMIFRKFDSGK